MTFFKFIFTILALFTTHLAFAKNIDLYDQPKNDAKIIGAIDSEVGLIPIFSPKNSEWMKVGDPRNGNTGWIKTSALADISKNSAGFSFTQKVIDDGTGPRHIIQFGTPKQLSPTESKAFVKQMELHQQAIQKDMQKMMQDIYKNTQILMPNFPIIVPVIMVPQIKSIEQNRAVKKEMSTGSAKK